MDLSVKRYDGDRPQLLREQQERRFLRRLWAGMLLLALLVITYWLLRANPRWLWPAGWWRLW